MSRDQVPTRSEFDELQSKFAFQEHTIESLNQALAQQQAQITLLERKVSLMSEKLKSLNASNIAHASEETPPPHY
jgi:SlyX protein